MPEGHPEVRLRRTVVRSRVTPRPLVQTQTPYQVLYPGGLKASASNPLIAVHIFLFNSISFTLRSNPASLGHCRDPTLSSGSDWMLRTGRRLVSPHHPHRALITLRVQWSRPHIARDTNEPAAAPEPNRHLLFQNLWPLSPVDSCTGNESPESLKTLTDPQVAGERHTPESRG